MLSITAADSAGPGSRYVLIVACLPGSVSLYPYAIAVSVSAKIDDVLPVAHQWQAVTVCHDEINAVHGDVGLRFRDVHAVDMDHRFRARKRFRTDLPAKVLAAPEGDMQAELFVEQCLADWFDPERVKHAKAKLGDTEAADNLESVISDFLDASKAVSTTSAEYAVDFGKSIAALDGVIGTASNQAAIANQQLAVAQAQLDALNSIAASLGSSSSSSSESTLPLVV